MAWTDNGWVNYAGEKHVKSAPSLAAIPVHVEGTRPSQQGHNTAYGHDPRQDARRGNTAAQIQVDIARQGGLTIMLNAAGELVEAPTRQMDARLTRALAGRTPKSNEELNAWLKASDPTLSPAQALELTIDYEATAGPLPSAPPDAPATRRHTLGSLGLRSASKLTQTQFAEKLKFHNVPEDQHITLAYEAFRAGHIVPDDDERGMTFQPSVTMSKKKATDDMQARAKVVRDIQANLVQVRALSSGAAPTAAVRTPVRPQRSGLDIAAMARVFAAFVQSQGSDTSVRHEIAAARREVEALKQRVAADREARRLTGRV